MSLRRRRRQVAREGMEKADLTPMIDATFLLLVFFLVTFKFKTLEGRLDAALPPDRGTGDEVAEPIEKVDIVLRVASLEPRKLRYRVGLATFGSIEELGMFLNRFDPEETPISIDARKGTLYKDVVQVLDLVIAKEFEKVAFAGTHEEE